MSKGNSKPNFLIDAARRVFRKVSHFGNNCISIQPIVYRTSPIFHEIILKFPVRTDIFIIYEFMES